jgi:Tfp pilus assembly protein PilN
MNDINFFEPYLNKTNKKKSYDKYLPLVLVSIIVISIIGYQITLSLEKSKLTKEVASIEDEINDPGLQTDYSKALKAQEEMNAIKLVLEETEAIVSIIENDFNVTKSLVDNLMRDIPENTYIESMAYGNSRVRIGCISDTYNSAAQFVYNLKQSDTKYSSVFMPSVTEDNGDYRYTLDVVIGGEINETNQ